MQRTYYMTNCVVYLLVPIAVGWLTGWLVGSSQSPVVATTIPLIFGLLTAIGFGLVGAILRKSAIVDAIRAVDLSDDIRSRLESEIRAGVSSGTAIFAASGVIVFCIFFYIGVLQGIARRVPTYPPLTAHFENIVLEPEETAALYHVRISLAAKGVGIDDYRALMIDLFKPIFTAEYNAQTPDERRRMRLQRFQNAVDALLYRRAEPGDVPIPPLPVPSPQA